MHVLTKHDRIGETNTRRTKRSLTHSLRREALLHECQSATCSQGAGKRCSAGMMQCLLAGKYLKHWREYGRILLGVKALERCVQDIVIPICIRCTSAQHPISQMAHPVFVVLVPVVRPNLTHTHTLPTLGARQKERSLETIGYSRIFSTQRQQQPHTQTDNM